MPARFASTATRSVRHPIIRPRQATIATRHFAIMVTPFSIAARCTSLLSPLCVDRRLLPVLSHKDTDVRGSV
jgi:hypothetical protein